MADLWKDFWIRETGTGQQVAQLHDRNMMMIMMMIMIMLIFGRLVMAASTGLQGFCSRFLLRLEVTSDIPQSTRVPSCQTKAILASH